MCGISQLVLLGGMAKDHKLIQQLLHSTIHYGGGHSPYYSTFAIIDNGNHNYTEVPVRLASFPGLPFANLLFYSTRMAKEGMR